jgi:hypothetical protein
VILCQEGYGAGEKIKNGLTAGAIHGLIVSPRYHSPHDIGQFISGLRQEFGDAYLLLDPEFNLGLVPGGQVGRLAEYPHYHEDLDWSSFTAGKVGQYVEETIALQENLPVSRLVSPAAGIASLRDWQGPACLSLFEHTIASTGQPRSRNALLLSLVVGDPLLSAPESVNELLDVLTILDCRGFYLTVDRQNAEDTIWCGTGQDVALGSLLYMVRVLSLNGFEVVCGHTDFPGVLMLGAGATSVASGWFKKQRLFDSGRFAPGPSGGRQPKDYYASGPLMNWIPLSPDLDLLDRAGLLTEVLSDTPCDEILRDARRGERWTLEVSTRAFWFAMQNAENELRTLDAEARTAYVIERLAAAHQIWDAIHERTQGGPALSVTNTNIGCWDRAFGSYQDRVNR